MVDNLAQLQQRQPAAARFCLDPTRTFTDKTVTLREAVNQEAAQFLMSLDKAEWKEFMEKASGEDDVSEKKPTSRETDQLYRDFNRFLASVLGSTDGVRRKYTHPIGRSFWRRYTSRGLQRIKRVFRGVLCRGMYTDVDAVNALFTMLLQLCRADGLSTPELRSYVAQRDERLQGVMAHFQCSREKAKEMFIKTAFWHKPCVFRYPFLDAFDAEMKAIQRHFLATQKYQFLRPLIEKETNVAGAFLKALYDFHEGQMLDAIYTYMTTNECYKNTAEIGVLAFDGFQLYGDHTENAQLLLDVAGAVRDATGFKMDFAFKPFDDTIHVPEDFVYDGLQTYEQKAAEFDLTHVKVRDVFVRKRGFEHDVLTETQIRTMYRHISVLDENGIECNFIENWLRNNNTMTVYERMDVYPNPQEAERHPNDFNFWTPFAMDVEIEKLEASTQNGKSHYKADSEGLALILDQINILCNHEEHVVNFLLDWMANMVQYPWNKSLMPVLIGAPGCGKTWFVKLLRALFGAAKIFECTDPQRDIFGSFNPRMRDAFLVNLSEVGGKSFYDAYDKFKALVTDPRLQINAKGKDLVDITSHHHWITTTNNEDPLPTDDKDRRAALIRSSDEKVGDNAWFDRLHKLIEQLHTLLTFWTFLKARPCKEQLTKEDLPETEHHQMIKKQNRDPLLLWVEHLASLSNNDYYEIEYEIKNARKRNGDPTYGDIETYTELSLPIVNCFQLFRQWCRDANITGYVEHLNTFKFGTRLGRLAKNGELPGFWSEDAVKVAGKTTVVKHFHIAKLRTHFGLIETEEENQSKRRKIADSMLSN